MAEVNGFNSSVNGYHAKYSPVAEAERIFNLLISKADLRLPSQISCRKEVEFTSHLDDVYFPIPFKETETTAALKALEAGVAAEIASLRYEVDHSRHIRINLEKVACFMLSSYLATVDGYGKLDPRSKKKIKGTVPSREPYHLPTSLS
jgi:hypothetical protein